MMAIMMHNNHVIMMFAAMNNFVSSEFEDNEQAAIMIIWDNVNNHVNDTG